MSDGFWKIAAADPGRTALIEPDGTAVTAGDLLASSNRTANALRSLGLQRGDTVAALLPNGRTFMDVYLAAMQSGLYFTPINTHLKAGEIAYIVTDSGAKAFIAGARYSSELGEVALVQRFASGGAVDGFASFEDLQASQPDTPPDDRSAGTWMLYTGGTTGHPKAVRRPLPEADPDTMAMLMSALANFVFGLPDGDGVHLVTGPLYHSAPLAFGAITTLQLGHTLVFMDGGWSPEAGLELIDRYRVTSTHMVPTMFHRMLSLPDDVRARYDVSSLQVVIHGAAPCPPDEKRRMIEWWGPVLGEYYAGTEGGATYVTSPEWLEHPGTVGKPILGSQVRILNDEGKELPTGEPGTIWMLNIAGAFEYLGDQDKTAAAQQDGLFTLGDVGYVDEDGYVFLCDRKVDMIISGGVNIYPAEVEAVLLQHPAVGDVAVIGVPDDEWGEQVKAIVEPSGPVTEDELIAFCRERIAHFKCPKTVELRDSLPRNEMGKLAKRTLRDAYWRDRTRAI